MRILIEKGRLIDPASGTDKICDIYIENGIVVKIGENPGSEADFAPDRRIDAKGLWVTPGFIDLHAHLREPGFEHKETIATGAASAAAGGFTTVCAMPNTDPVCDSGIVAEYIKLKAERADKAEVLPVGAITKGQKGETLSEIGKMASAGICALSEDGKSVANAGLMRTAMVYAKMFDLPIFDHCEEPTLMGGSMNKGPRAELLGMKGIAPEAEEIMVARDIILARSAGVHLHICHISTKGAIEQVRRAKAAGQSVTAEVCPHHFSLSDEFITDYDTNTKMSPPLRSAEDVKCILEALKDGTIEVIATDHAPHASEDKLCEYDRAAFGIVGFETAFGLGMSNLVKAGILSPMEFIAKLTCNPAKILKLERGAIKEGARADITISDPDEKWTVEPEKFLTKGRNTPFGGFELTGRVKFTLVNGNLVYEG
ncbi:MAG: dihydroorotase [Firmicutes bacterium]|nr:dihydroorotase [Bacillota bacterium]